MHEYIVADLTINAIIHCYLHRFFIQCRTKIDDILLGEYAKYCFWVESEILSALCILLSKVT